MVTSAFGWLRQEDCHGFEIILSSRGRPCLKEKKNLRQQTSYKKAIGEAAKVEPKLLRKPQDLGDAGHTDCLSVCLKKGTGTVLSQPKRETT